MTKVTLIPRAYGPESTHLLDIFSRRIRSLSEDLHISQLRISTNSRGHIEITMGGDDEEFLRNVLDQRYGIVPSFEKVSIDIEYSGYLVDVGQVGYGLYIDIGLSPNPPTDLLIPLHRLREQFDMPGKSLNEICRKQVLVENLPVNTRITNIDSRKAELEGEFAESYIDRINAWANETHQRLLIFGSTYRMIDNALSNTNHKQDVIEIERIGTFEFSVTCKLGTRATGILAAIGPRLRGIPVYPFIPKKVRG
ncbi:MAG: DUF2110 family protein [Candidatus Lokiarchaeota archaeon]|nr:DUF2110 family protein [Candidatus Lokiarchaeota archaeon]